MSSKTERQTQVDALIEGLKGSPDIYVTDFSGLSVGKMTELRRRLRAAGARYVVVKNTLAQRAPRQRVLHHDVFDACGAQFPAQLGHPRDVEAREIRHVDGRRAAELGDKSRHDALFLLFGADH